MSNNFNIKPYHGAPQPLGSDSNSTVFYSFYQLNNKAFQDSQALGTTSNSTTFKRSGYQYITQIITIAAASASEAQGVIDRVVRTVNRTVSEFIGSTEIADLRPPRESENYGILDTVTRIIRRNVTENIGGVDIGSIVAQPKQDQEAQGLKETAIRVVTRLVDEFIGGTETSFFFVSEDHIFSTKIVGQQPYNPIYSVGIKPATYEANTYSTQIVGIVNNLVSVTATGGTYQYPASGGAPVLLPNPFNPTLSIDGANYIGTAPVGAAGTTIFVDLPNSLIPNNTWADCFNFGMSLDYSGGTFSIDALNYPGTVGSNISLFGLNGTITTGSDPGKINVLSNSVKGYRVGGIFGTPKLNKQLNLTVAGSLIGTPIVLNSNLVALGNPAGLGARSISALIANACGITLTWAVTDVPVSNFSLENGMNGLSALQSLASRAFGVLRWNGNNSYIVAYPDIAIGLYQPPAPQLIAAGGLEYEEILDLETGLGGSVRPNSAVAPFQGVYALPVYSTNTGAVTTAGGTNGTPTTVQIVKISKLLTVDDPPLVFDLPYGYDKVYIQILVSPSGATGGNNLVDLNNYVTRDPKQYFEFNVASLGSNYLFNTLLGNAYIPQVAVDYKVFPVSNSSVDAGNFVMTLACTLKQLPAVAPPVVNPLNLQFVRVYQGSFTNLFYGVLPIPGMYGKAIVDGMVVEGVIETVSFTPPGFVTVNVAQYRRLNYIVPYSQLGPGTS